MAPDLTAKPTCSDGFGLYVHWPFCRAKCPYCDFNSHVRACIDQDRWAGALQRELDAVVERVPKRPLTSVFFGGGTPSLMAPGTVATVLDRAVQHWTPAPGIEVTLEANPTSAEASAFQAFRLAGVNRVSIGVQALDDAALRFLGRTHGASDARNAVLEAQRRFDRVSFDLIYARPGQTVAAWTKELTQAMALASGHLSVYQLTIEPGTAFHAPAQRGDLTLPDEDTAAALFETTQALLDRAGMPAYEISNHATPGQECQHNLVYWRYQDYAGIGPGAHGRLTVDGHKLATRTHRAPEVWLERVERTGSGADSPRIVDPADRASEALMMGLRLREGVALDRLTAEANQPLDRLINIRALGRLRAGGFLDHTTTHLRATPAGRQRLNAVLAALLA